MRTPCMVPAVTGPVRVTGHTRFAGAAEAVDASGSLAQNAQVYSQSGLRGAKKVTRAKCRRLPAGNPRMSVAAVNLCHTTAAIRADVRRTSR